MTVVHSLALIHRDGFQRRRTRVDSLSTPQLRGVATLVLDSPGIYSWSPSLGVLLEMRCLNRCECSVMIPRCISSWLKSKVRMRIQLRLTRDNGRRGSHAFSGIIQCLKGQLGISDCELVTIQGLLQRLMWNPRQARTCPPDSGLGTCDPLPLTCDTPPQIASSALSTSRAVSKSLWMSQASLPRD